MPTGYPRPEMQEYFESACATETDECILWPFYTDKDGYPCMRANGKKVRVCRFMLRRKVGPPSEGHQAAHSCRNIHCINHRHLSWKTPLDNMDDKIRDGTNIGHPKGKVNLRKERTPNPSVRGVNHYRNILSEDHVHWIRRQLELGKHQRAIADQIKVTLSTVNNIRRKDSWSWLPLQDPYIKKWRDLDD
jgi:hypothetical protein